MAASAIIQQQTADAAPPSGSLDLFWTPEHVVAVTGCPPGSVGNNWPLVARELVSWGIYDRWTAAAAIATVAIESASTFEPVREAFWLSEAWRSANLRYYPFYGRGFIQLTWESNYRAASGVVGVDLVSDPDRAMQPSIAAAVFAWFFWQANVYSAARAQDWAEVRRRVQGAYAGLDRLTAICRALLGV